MPFCRAIAGALLIAAVACAPRGPVLGTATKPPGVGGTIAGHVNATKESVPVVGRKVTAVDVVTGAHHEVSTTDTGGYTLQVPKGVYRMEVEIRRGETLSKQPGEIDVNTGDLDAGRDFEITRGS